MTLETLAEKIKLLQCVLLNFKFNSHTKQYIRQMIDGICNNK